jgi:hypothetical protein
MKTSELIAVLAQRLAENGDLEVAVFDAEPCEYFPVVEATVTMSFSKPRRDLLVLKADDMGEAA